MNRAAYNAIAPRWDEARHSFYGREQFYLDTLLAGVPSGATVLDAGCGTGRPMAEYVIARGMRVVGYDQSEGMLALARQRFPEQRWICAALENCEFDGGEAAEGKRADAETGGARYAAAICWDALFHIERHHHQNILRRIRDRLHPGARLMLTCGGSPHPAFTDTMFGETFFYDSHTPEETLGLLAGLGFRPLVAEFMNPPTGGRDKGRYAVVAQLG